MDLVIIGIVCTIAVLFLVRRFRDILAGKKNLGCSCSDCDATCAELRKDTKDPE